MCDNGIVLAVNNGREFRLVKDQTPVFIRHIETPMFLENIRPLYRGSARVEGTESAGSLYDYWVRQQGFTPVALKAFSVNMGGKRFRLKADEMLAALLKTDGRPELRLITREANDKVKEHGWTRQPIKVSSRAEVAQLVLDTRRPEETVSDPPSTPEDTKSKANTVSLEYEDADLLDDPFDM